MLDLTGRPAATSSLALAAAKANKAGRTLEDVKSFTAARTDISATTRDRYVTAILQVGKLANCPLSLIDARLDQMEARYPLDGFDPSQWRTNAAYQTFRRRVLAALKEYLGVLEAKRTLREQDDGWTELFAAIEPLTKGRIGVSARWHPQKLSLLRSFATIARSYGWQPRDLTAQRAAQILQDFGGAVRDANARSLVRLEELREFPETLPHLPRDPIGFVPRTRTLKPTAMPEAWAAQYLPWIERVTTKAWDPVTKSHTRINAKHAKVLVAAFGTCLRAGLETGVISREDQDVKDILACDETLCGIAGELFRRAGVAKEQGRLKPRTSRKYLRGIKQIMVHLALDTGTIDQIIANNQTAKAGAEAEKSMTPANRKFCEGLVNQLHLRRRFLGSYLTLRDEADRIMAAAKAEDRGLSKRELSQVRMLGVCACFAAIEIGGAPIRRTNAMALTCVGEDAQISIPLKGRKPIHVVLPAGTTKNNVRIEFPVKYNKYGAHDTITWYHNVIRPLFSHAEKSRYLFPAVRVAGRHLDPDYFAAQFERHMRTVVNLPMSPHQMRHGQTSLLLDRHPNEIEVIAKRIDDTADTLRTYYGWLNSIKLVERGQDLMIGLIDD
ncbi:hypothetical protein [Pararhodobacter sp. CCB-MM2]|uniref:hypothetical protein n=1 Tax=Pararhodobacter sp. CCB-MM2 TaxID=1786003 RepID=UPI00082B3FF0|nr:hypothetical protein [Pararhodobacter sp. CCB-MM2]